MKMRNVPIFWGVSPFATIHRQNARVLPRGLPDPGAQ